MKKTFDKIRYMAERSRGRLVRRAFAGSATHTPPRPALALPSWRRTPFTRPHLPRSERKEASARFNFNSLQSKEGTKVMYRARAHEGHVDAYDLIHIPAILDINIYRV